VGAFKYHRIWNVELVVSCGHLMLLNFFSVVQENKKFVKAGFFWWTHFNLWVDKWTEL